MFILSMSNDMLHGLGYLRTINHDASQSLTVRFKPRWQFVLRHGGLFLNVCVRKLRWLSDYHMFFHLLLDGFSPADRTNKACIAVILINKSHRHQCCFHAVLLYGFNYSSQMTNWFPTSSCHIIVEIQSREAMRLLHSIKFSSTNNIELRDKYGWFNLNHTNWHSELLFVGNVL